MFKSRLVKIPQPAGIIPPEKENPITVLFPVWIKNPAEAASPPEAPPKVAPWTIHWKPEILKSTL